MGLCLYITKFEIKNDLLISKENIYRVGEAK